MSQESKAYDEKTCHKLDNNRVRDVILNKDDCDYQEAYQFLKLLATPSGQE